MKRDEKTREQDFVTITRLALRHPIQASSLTSFIELVSKKLGLTPSQAKRDILELRKRKKALKSLNYKEEVEKKIVELALLKEESLKCGNLNAYLGAIKCECEMLNLKGLNVLMLQEEENKSNLKEKKKEMLDLILKQKS